MPPPCRYALLPFISPLRAMLRCFRRYAAVFSMPIRLMRHYLIFAARLLLCCRYDAAMFYAITPFASYAIDCVIFILRAMPILTPLLMPLLLPPSAAPLLCWLMLFYGAFIYDTLLCHAASLLLPLPCCSMLLIFVAAA